MSYALELRSHSRSFTQVFSSFTVPAFLTGTAARFTVAIVVVALVVGYIMQIGILTTSGYEIATLERQVDALSSDTEKLSSTLASYQAISSVEKRLEPGSMIPASNITHIKSISEAAVAQR